MSLNIQFNVLTYDTLNSVGMIYALVVITMVCRKKVSVRIKSLITSAVT